MGKAAQLAGAGKMAVPSVVKAAKPASVQPKVDRAIGAQAQDIKPVVKVKKITTTQRELIKDKKLVGHNPGNIHQPKGKTLKVDAELPGGIREARQLNEKLTVDKLPQNIHKYIDKKLPDGKYIQIRVQSSSKTPKIEIKDPSRKIHEKITFIK